MNDDITPLVLSQCVLITKCFPQCLCVCTAVGHELITVEVHCGPRGPTHPVTLAALMSPSHSAKNHFTADQYSTRFTSAAKARQSKSYVSVVTLLVKGTDPSCDHLVHLFMWVIVLLLCVLYCVFR